MTLPGAVRKPLVFVEPSGRKENREAGEDWNGSVQVGRRVLAKGPGFPNPHVGPRAPCEPEPNLPFVSSFLFPLPPPYLPTHCCPGFLALW